MTGPYEWGVQPDIEIEELGAFNGPKSVVFNDSDTNKTIYSLWLGGGGTSSPHHRGVAIGYILQA